MLPQVNVNGRPGDDLRVGASEAPTAEEAVAEVRAAFADVLDGCVIFFSSVRYDRAALAAALTRSFAGARVVGCSTAGEIAPAGYRRGSMVAVHLPAGEFATVAMVVENLSAFSPAESQQRARQAVATLRERAPSPIPGHTFGLVLIDGLSRQEEWVVSTLSSALGDIPLFGGSAGDDLAFHDTYVCTDGRFWRDSAVLLLVNTSAPFQVFRTQHFVHTDRKMVVTAADPTARRVMEINGESAAREYARLVGLEVGHLTPMAFAANPVVVKVGGLYYVRSIQKVNPDESLTFFCAIDEGIVLTVAEGLDIVENLREALAGVRRQVGEPRLIIGCDCVLRRLEVERKALSGPVSRLLAASRVVGFSTYGEQFNAMHVNQTFTGVAIGARSGGSGADGS
ncbi:MAG: FIST domain containing protein [Rhodospirillales bacterium]|nr:MAG: FIST domain containing protein [Rhodospirillales bacterium]